MNILTIGNSFTWSLRKYFPDIVHACGEKLNICYMNFGGCSLKRHWGYMEAEENNKEIYIYANTRMDQTLEKTPWDIVTIQQASPDSWRKDTFEPYAGNIIDYVHKHAPGAEIVVQQTWAYRNDHVQMREGGSWGITQKEMYEKLTENYKELAKRYSLRMIPTGYAVELARKNSPVKFQNYDPALLETLSWPDYPNQSGDVVGSMWWEKNKESGEMELGLDAIHLNTRGTYLQACLFLAFLYKIDPEESVKYFLPEEIGNSDASFLREMARKAANTPFEEIR